MKNQKVRGNRTTPSSDLFQEPEGVRCERRTGQLIWRPICTAEKANMMAEVFLDTAYAIALSSPNDFFIIAPFIAVRGR